MAPTTRLQSRRAISLVKLLRTGRTHHGHTYTEGLNVCSQPWDDGHCTPGGLYACELRHLFEWITLYDDITEVAWVEVPAGAQVARFDTKIKASALVLSGVMPIAEAIRIAVRAGANINDGVLCMASERDNADLVRLLLQAGAVVHALTDQALRMASIYGRTKTLRVLLQAGADVHANNDEALRLASRFGHTECVRILLEAGADVRANNDEALLQSSMKGYTEVVRLLLQAGADVHANGDQAFRIASAYGRYECTLLLKSFM